MRKNFPCLFGLEVIANEELERGIRNSVWR